MIENINNTIHNILGNEKYTAILCSSYLYPKTLGISIPKTDNVKEQMIIVYFIVMAKEIVKYILI